MVEYREISVLGTGAFGIVTLCERSTDNVSFAKKTLHGTPTKPHIERFRHEVKILSGLDHPNIVKVVDSSLAVAPFWFVMPYYKSSLKDDLQNVLANDIRINSVFTAILNGMEHAHDQKVIHRDLKPGNIVLNDYVDVVITDFGLGRIFDAEGDRFTQSGVGMGTRLYAAPEQLSNAKSVDHRADIYSLGRILYELYTDKIDSALQDYTRLPAPIGLIVKQCTQYNPDSRFQSINELRTAWQGAINASHFSTDDNEVDRLINELRLTPTAIHKIHQLLKIVELREGDDSLLERAMFSIPPQSIATVCTVEGEKTRKLIQSFIESIVLQPVGHAKADRVAECCGNLFVTVQDSSIRSALVFCLVKLVAKTKRHTVSDTLSQVLQQVVDANDKIAIRSRLSLIDMPIRISIGLLIDLEHVDLDIASLFK